MVLVSYMQEFNCVIVVLCTIIISGKFWVSGVVVPPSGALDVFW